MISLPQTFAAQQEYSEIIHEDKEHQYQLTLNRWTSDSTEKSRFKFVTTEKQKLIPF